MALKKSLLHDFADETRFGRALRTTYRFVRQQNATRGTKKPSQYVFTDRSRGSNRLCIVLAGYKEELWNAVFGRLKAYLPEDFDVCIMTSGLENQVLKDMCERNSWSYLATKKNQLSFIQNLAIELHPNAKWILKMDEDIFVTEHFSESLFLTFNEVENNSFYVPAFVSPILNVNCFSFLTLLRKTGLIDDFCNQGFGEIKLTDGLNHHRHILRDPAIARYLWGETQPTLADIDALQKSFLAEEPSFEICPYRFSIGCILFKRNLWIKMKKFPILRKVGLGDDEEGIGRYAFFSGQAIVVDTNCIVGHLGYGAQTEGMLEFYKKHSDIFALKD